MKKLAIFLLILCLNNLLIAQEEEPEDHETWEFILEGIGDVCQYAIPLSGGLISIIEKDYEGTKMITKAIITNVAITYILKDVTHRKRPEGRELYDAFPSGHTSAAFTGASFIQVRYGRKYGIPAYILAAITGVSRVEGPDGYHDFWDVLAGAAVGIGSTYMFTKPYEKNKVTLRFSSNKDLRLLSFTYTF